MALVPKSYPAEPGATRCGDTYKTTVNVTGAIPGTDYTGGFTKNIGPVPFLGATANVPLFTSRQDFNKQLRRERGVQDRIKDLEHIFFIEDHRFNKQERTAVKWLIDMTWALLDEAYIVANKIKSSGDTHSKKAQTLVIEALKHLRCAEYWTWRVILHGQALETYESELGLSAGPQVPVFQAPLEGVLPPPSPPPKKKTAPPKKDNTGLIVFGLTALVAGVIFVPKMLKQ